MKYQKMAMSLISIHNYVDTILTWYVQSITENPQVILIQQSRFQK